MIFIRPQLFMITDPGAEGLRTLSEDEKNDGGGCVAARVHPPPQTLAWDYLFQRYHWLEDGFVTSRPQTIHPYAFSQRP